MTSDRDELGVVVASALDGRCAHCLRPLATDEDWQRYDDDEGKHLCWEEPQWGNCAWDAAPGLTRESLASDAILSSDWLARVKAEAAATALEEAAREFDEWYATDIFRPLSSDDHQAVNDAVKGVGVVRDRISADMQRRAAAQMRSRAADLRSELRQ